MSSRSKKPDDDMLITHLQPPPKNMAGRNPAAPVPVNAKDLPALQSDLVAAKTAEDRRAIIQSIQQQFGNEAADKAVQQTRSLSPPDEKGGANK